MREKGQNWKTVQAKLKTAQAKDQKYDDGRILCSMCSSPLPEAKRAQALFSESNLGDPGLFEGSVELECEAVNALLQLMHAPKGGTGFLVSGGANYNF